MTKGTFFLKVEELLKTIALFEQDIKILEWNENALVSEHEQDKKKTVKKIQSEIKTIKDLAKHTYTEIEELVRLWEEFIDTLNKITIEGINADSIKRNLELYNHKNNNVVRMHNVIASMVKLANRFENNTDSEDETCLKLIQINLFELQKKCLWYTNLAFKNRMTWQNSTRGLGVEVYKLIVKYFSTK